MKKKYRKIELYTEKTGSVIRTLRFTNEKEFFDFLAGFNQMRYPGYSWRDVKK
ncbi:MAG: hypothetical protein ACP5D6_11080 [Kosmotogaceae bacterium]